MCLYFDGYLILLDPFVNWTEYLKGSLEIFSFFLMNSSPNSLEQANQIDSFSSVASLFKDLKLLNSTTKFYFSLTRYFRGIP